MTEGGTQYLALLEPATNERCSSERYAVGREDERAMEGRRVSVGEQGGRVGAWRAAVP